MKIYCSGIGGIGLSAYASLQRSAGHDVAGSDRSESALLADLREQGIVVTLQQDGSALSKDIDLFVYSEAVPADAPERQKAAELGIKQQSYFEALGDLSRGHRVIAVCGTHGKSSTTAMAARVLIAAGTDPTVVVGTKLAELGGRNWRTGKSDLFLVEACEYRRNFRFIDPSIVLMTNVDGDHFDAFASVKEYQDAFVEFLARLPEDGIVVTHGDDQDAARVAAASGRRVMDADELSLPELRVPGRHMRQNAQLVLSLAGLLGIPDTEARAALAGYAGSWRRMEIRGTYGDGITVIDDYAHHPREIRATLAGAKEAYPGRRIICVFQPHTHDRTIKLYGDFIVAFRDAQTVVITDVYDARKEIETATVDLPLLVSDIGEESGTEALLGGSLQDSEKILRSILQPNDVVLCMGAGDIPKLSDRLIAKP